jgi:1-acyl-sn-glycerol-3-phosphate acyltransferase
MAKKVLDEGGVLGVHVEGTRSPDGKLYDARAGFARLALDSKATIVPVAITYQDDDPVTGKHRARLQFGKPITYSEYKDKKIYDIAKSVTKTIQTMSGQTLAGRFAKIISRLVGGK